jgi:hypothetical protein
VQEGFDSHTLLGDIFSVKVNMKTKATISAGAKAQ